MATASPSLAAPCAFLVCHGRSGVLYQPGAGTEDEPVGQVRVLALLSRGDLSQGTERRHLWGWTLDRVPPPCSLCLAGGACRRLGNKLGRTSVPPN